MKPDIYQSDPEDFTNTGTVTINMECKEPTNTVTIHANKLTITSQSMTDFGKVYVIKQYFETLKIVLSTFTYYCSKR